MWFREKRLYADAAASTPLSVAAKAELVRLLDLYGNPGGLHKEAVAAKEALADARKRVARALECHVEELVFTGSGTEANNLAILGLLRPLLREQGEAHVITTTIEHSSVLEPLHALEDDGLYVTALGVNHEGRIDLKELEEAINNQTVLVTIQMVNSEIGTIQDIREVSKLLKKQNRKIYLHCDASQAPLWQNITVERLGVDLQTLDGQKVMGPKGVGVLYIRKDTPVESIVWGGGQEHGLRAGTENAPLVGAFAVALEDAQKNYADNTKRVSEVRDYVWQQIQKLIPDAVLNGAVGDRRIANNINVSIPGLDAEMGVIAMDALGVAVSTRSSCDIGDEEPSHVIRAIGTPKDLQKTAI
ncbi:MAG TPA: cysteine desulfurase family protein, partial [Candidatus Paceibacterota bacterium]